MLYVLHSSKYFLITGFLSLVCLFVSYSVYSQEKGTVHGVVKDGDTGETLIGVNVIVDSTTGVSTDVNGFYSLSLPRGKYQLAFRYIGYETLKRNITVVASRDLEINISLKAEAVALQTVVVSAGKFKQKLSDVTVSMEIIKPGFIENTNTVNIENVLTKMPGIDVLGDQPSIRGGSGYSYGAGSRVLVLVDDLPILTADVGEVKWNFLPVENIEQIEILKGASSALYGSSALNGVINIRTAWPEIKPETKAVLFSGLYIKPKRKEMAWWWKSAPVFGGASFSDSRKAGRFDIVSGINLYSNPGYREESYEKRARANVKLRYRPKNTEALSCGLSTNIQWQESSDFFIWQDADSGAFLQNPAGITPTRGFRFNADPWINFYDKGDGKHSLHTRFYHVDNRFDDNPDKDNGSDMYYGEYRYHKTFRQKLNLTIGMMGLYGVTNANLYGDHTNSNLALFSQLDYNFLKRFSASLGLRWETYTLDNSDRQSAPVMRAGLNFQAASYTFLRASFGQGFRYPSIAEKYTATSLGSLNIFPNPSLEPETGWSAELGVKQGFRAGKWKGFVDLAAFRTEYQNMIEYTFGIWLQDSTQIPTLDDLGFKSLNVGHARITGVELDVSGTGAFGKSTVTFFAGYTYMNPIDLSTDTLEDNILKYRYRHSLKGDFEITYGRMSLGANFIYNSFMERIDKAFEETILGQEIFPGLKDYREKNNKGHFVLNLRTSYQFPKLFKLSILVNNLLNEEYMGRPGDIQPPFNIVLQCVMKI